MIAPEQFYNICRGQGISFFAGVPDSLLQDLCAFLTDHVAPESHVIAANEGNAIGLAAGQYLASRKPALVYMQNSGQGNAVNPILSLADPEVYGIPMLLVVGWRGEPGIHDEPQHVKQGRVMKALFDAMEVPFEILDANVAIAEAQVASLLHQAVTESRPVALAVRKNTFEKYLLKNKMCSPFVLNREKVIGILASAIPENSVIISTTGHISRELYEFRLNRSEGHSRDFLTVGSMGHASQIAMGIALTKPDRLVFCFDGDGAALMHLGGLAIISQSKCRNLKHVVLNNGAHDSVGGQPTVALSVSLSQIAKACGYAFVRPVSTNEELVRVIPEFLDNDGPSFLEVYVSTGARKDLGRPKTTPKNNKHAFMNYLTAPDKVEK